MQRGGQPGKGRGSGRGRHPPYCPLLDPVAKRYAKINSDRRSRGGDDSDPSSPDGLLTALIARPAAMTAVPPVAPTAICPIQHGYTYDFPKDERGFIDQVLRLSKGTDENATAVFSLSSLPLSSEREGSSSSGSYLLSILNGSERQQSRRPLPPSPSPSSSSSVVAVVQSIRPPQKLPLPPQLSLPPLPPPLASPPRKTRRMEDLGGSGSGSHRRVRIYGNERGWARVREILQPHRRDGLLLPRCILLIGPPGVGKTTGVRQCGEEFGYAVQEVNASDERTAASLAGELAHLCVRKFGASGGDNGAASGRSLLLLDEIDGLDEERGGADAIIRAARGISSSSSLRRGGEGGAPDVAKRIVCIANDGGARPVRDIKAATGPTRRGGGAAALPPLFETIYINELTRNAMQDAFRHHWETGAIPESSSARFGRLVSVARGDVRAMLNEAAILRGGGGTVVPSSSSSSSSSSSYSEDARKAYARDVAYDPFKFARGLMQPLGGMSSRQPALSALVDAMEDSEEAGKTWLSGMSMSTLFVHENYATALFPAAAAASSSSSSCNIGGAFGTLEVMARIARGLSDDAAAAAAAGRCTGGGYRAAAVVSRAIKTGQVHPENVRPRVRLAFPKILTRLAKGVLRKPDDHRAYRRLSERGEYLRSMITSSPLSPAASPGFSVSPQELTDELLQVLEEEEEGGGFPIPPEILREWIHRGRGLQGLRGGPQGPPVLLPVSPSSK